MARRPQRLGFALALAIGALVPTSGAESPEPRPDLVIESLELSHDELAPDTVVGTSFSVANRGNADAPTFRIAIYHSDGRVVPERGNVTRIGVVTAYGGIASGGRATFSLPVRIPPCERCRPGSVYAYADAWGTVLESSENNNYKAVPIRVDPSYQPNLVVSDLSLVPDRGPMGRKVMLQATLENVAPYVAQGPVKVGVYCSGDFELDRSDLLLASWVQPALPASGKLSVRREVEVDKRCAVHGQHVQLGLLADVDDYVSESNEDDNGALQPYWVFRAPDLAPGEVAVTPRAGPPNAPAFLSFVVKNDGKTAAGPFQVGVYLSKDATVTTEDSPLQMLDLPGLGATKSTGTLHREIAIPDRPSGKYYVGVVVDVTRANGELREHNNMKSVPLEVRRVDLTDQYFFTDKSAARAGDPLEVRFSVRNTGTDPAPAFKVAFYYSDDPRFDAKDVELGHREVAKLDKGAATKEEVVALRIPAQAATGYRFVLMVTDVDDAVYETDEHDNLALRAVLIGSEVRPSGGPRP